MPGTSQEYNPKGPPCSPSPQASCGKPLPVWPLVLSGLWLEAIVSGTWTLSGALVLSALISALSAPSSSYLSLLCCFFILLVPFPFLTWCRNPGRGWTCIQSDLWSGETVVPEGFKVQHHGQILFALGSMRFAWIT